MIGQLGKANAKSVTKSYRANRLTGNPIIRPNMDDRMGANINGPSLISTPEWLPAARGKYYLFFEHHIASPDVLIDEDNRRLVMYFHGRRSADGPVQETRVAVSSDGLMFQTRPEVLGRPYFRVFQHDGRHYAIGMPGYVYRSADPLGGFEEGPQILPNNTRHVAMLLDGETLHLFHTCVGQIPESIMVGEIDLRADWKKWVVTDIREVLRPETEWEGANQPLVPSKRGPIDVPVNQLRDPAIFEEVDDIYLLYSVAGESGIAIASLST